jgi:hypothetical protein
MRAEPIAIDWTPELPIFAKESFLESVSDEYGWLGGTDDTGKLRCILPYTIVRKATVRMVRFRVETILLDDTLSVDDERAFLDSAMARFKEMGADIVIPATTNSIFRTYPTGATAAPYGTLAIDLTQSEESLWGNIHPKHRNVIRNAEKKGVVIQIGDEHARQAYELVRDTFKRSKLPFMEEASFAGMMQGLGTYMKVFVADHGGQIQGCGVFPYSTYGAFYVYGGSISEPLSGSMNLLQWEAIKHFRGLGVRRYDFCGVRISPEKGSKQAGLMMFKERFGPRLVQGYMWKSALSPLKSGIYSLAIRLFRGGDIVDAEKHKLTAPGGPA